MIEETQITIVGGGPVGLFLAVALVQRGISVIVVEKREQIASHSRAIGLHSPALRVLGDVGIADLLMPEGIAIVRAQAYWRDRPLARMHLARVLTPPYSCILSLPQVRTEQILEQALCRLSPGTLRRGTFALRFQEAASHLTLTVRDADREYRMRSDYLIGCDGKNSLIREQAGTHFRGGEFPDRYIMGDFADDTPFGAEAVLFLTPQGIVESFPLPTRQRRWVVHTGIKQGSELEPIDLVEQVASRTGQPISVASCTMFSTFGIQNYRADRLVSGRVILAGDAGHVCSPLGGQGMNLGLLDAALLAETLAACLQKPGDETALSRYNEKRLHSAKIAAERAAFNTIMGRGGPDALLRARAMATIMRFPPLHDHFARQFTMHGL